MPVSAKRKLVDMPEQSPPLKRVTRSRAAKTEKDAEAEPKITKITTASARASAKKQIPKETAKTKRKTKTDTQPIKTVDEELPEVPSKKQAPAFRPKTKEPIAKFSKENEKHPSVATRTRQAKVEKSSASKAKGPSKKSTHEHAPSTMQTNEETVPKTVEPTVRTTRGRAANITTNYTLTRAKAATAAPKKKVTFEDDIEQDKENQPIQDEKSKKAAPIRVTGLKAKPIRKPAPKKGTARGRKTHKDEATIREAIQEERPQPLSPKKVTQVAKTPSIGSEDELCGNKTPMKTPNRSPVKAAMSINYDADLTYSRPDWGAQNPPLSPTKEGSPSRLATSPKRPPPSPFKDALKESPKRVDIGVRPSQPNFTPQSPRKSTLNMSSPKRVNLGTSITQPSLTYFKSPTKTSLLQSPARRPGGSPTKTPVDRSPKKLNLAEQPDTDNALVSQQASTLELASSSQQNVVSSPLRAKSPIHQFRVYNMTPQEQAMKHKQATSTVHSPPRCSIADTTTEKMPENRPTQQNLARSSLCMQTEPATQSSPEPNFYDELICSNAEPESEDHLDFKNQKTVEDLRAEENIAKDNAIEDIMDEHSKKSLTMPAFAFTSTAFRDVNEESDLDDELSSPEKAFPPTSTRKFGVSARSFGTPVAASRKAGNHGPANFSFGHPSSEGAKLGRKCQRERDDVSMTPLAVQMSQWLASSPEKNAHRNEATRKRGVFSPAVPFDTSKLSTRDSPAKVSFFEDEMALRDELGDDVLDVEQLNEVQDDKENEIQDFQASQGSQGSDEYGDENALPDQPKIFAMQQGVEENTMTCTPAKVFFWPREIHTVSKVPLRPADDGSPTKVPRKRSRSMAGPLSVIKSPERLSISRDSVLSPLLQNPNFSVGEFPEEISISEAPNTPLGRIVSTPNAPGRTVRKAGVSNVLKGAVVYVDVHTSEGADASGIFIDLLTQMGARCLKQWHWNPRASIGGYDVTAYHAQENALSNTNTPGNKIGITHVVFKDGGKRTLEKVRESNGVVICVGVGWVLELVQFYSQSCI